MEYNSNASVNSGINNQLLLASVARVAGEKPELAQALLRAVAASQSLGQLAPSNGPIKPSASSSPVPPFASLQKQPSQQLQQHQQQQQQPVQLKENANLQSMLQALQTKIPAMLPPATAPQPQRQQSPFRQSNPAASAASTSSNNSSYMLQQNFTPEQLQVLLSLKLGGGGAPKMTSASAAASTSGNTSQMQGNLQALMMAHSGNNTGVNTATGSPSLMSAISPPKTQTLHDQIAALLIKQKLSEAKNAQQGQQQQMRHEEGSNPTSSISGSDDDDNNYYNEEEDERLVELRKLQKAQAQLRQLESSIFGQQQQQGGNRSMSHSGSSSSSINQDVATQLKLLLAHQGMAPAPAAAAQVQQQQVPQGEDMWKDMLNKAGLPSAAEQQQQPNHQVNGNDNDTNCHASLVQFFQQQQAPAPAPQQQQQLTPASSSNNINVQALAAILKSQPGAAMPAAAHPNGSYEDQLRRLAQQFQPTPAAAPAPMDVEEQAPPAQPEKKRRRGRTGTFPQKMHQMLEDMEKNDTTDIASFLEHGQAFGIHRPKDFAEIVMPKYFKMGSFASFQRQLNLYCFDRIGDGPDRGAYKHPLFIRGKPLLSTTMRRTKIKGAAQTAMMQAVAAAAASQHQQQRL